MWPSLDGSPGMVSTTELQNTAMDGRAGVLDVIHCKVAMFFPWKVSTVLLNVGDATHWKTRYPNDEISELAWAWIGPITKMHFTCNKWVQFPMVEQLRGWLFGQWSENVAWTLAKGPGSLNGYARLYGYWSPKWLLCPALVACLRVLLSLTAVDHLEPQWLDILQLDWFYPA